MTAVRKPRRLRPPVRVKSQKGAWEYLVRDFSTVEFNKESALRGRSEASEIHGANWLFGVVTLKSGKISYLRDGQEVTSRGPAWAVFYPPFAYARVAACDAHFVAQGLWSRAPLPKDFPQEPLLLSLVPDLPFPRSSAEVGVYLKRAELRESIDYCRNPPPLAARAKRLLDHQALDAALRIASVAASLRTTQAQVSRTFKAAFGISPLQYVHQIRAKTATFNLIRGDATIADTGMAVGFQDLARFYKAVKKVTSLTPGAYKAGNLGEENQKTPRPVRRRSAR